MDALLLFLVDSTLKELMQKHTNGLLEFRPNDSAISRRKSSSAWDSFHLIYDISNENSMVIDFVMCIKCKEFVPYRGPTTTQLLRHKCSPNHRSIGSFLTKKLKFSESDINNVRDAAMQFIVKDIRPFYALEGDGLRELCKALIIVGQKYTRMSDADIENLIPHRKVIKKRVDEKAIYVQKTIMEDFRRALEFPGSFSCTTDLWTDDYRHISYLCLTAHINILENEKILHKKYVYYMNSIDAMSKTAEVISKEIKAALEMFGVSEENMKNRIFWTTDRGGNIRLGLAQCKRLNCYAHMMNNIVEHMCKEEDARKFIKNATALVKFMKSSGLNSKLKKSLKSYTETRWNTVYDCIGSIHENYSDVLDLLIEKERTSNKEYVTRLTCLPKQKLHDITHFLSTFKNITNEIEGDKFVTIYRLWPAYIRINKLMESNVSDSMVIRKMKIIGRNYISGIHDDFSPTMEHKIGVFLHPMLKGLRIATSSEKEEIYLAVKSLFEDGESDITQLAPQSNSPPAECVMDVDNETYLFSEFITETEQPPVEIRSDELQRYIDFKFEKVIRISLQSHTFKSTYLVRNSHKIISTIVLQFGMIFFSDSSNE